jgi:hypothetical protein
LALALYASDMPVRKSGNSSWTLDMLTAWVQQGTDRLGGEEAVWYTDYRARQAYLSRDWHTYNWIWPDRRRADCARGMAYRVSVEGSYTSVMQWVPIGTDEDGAELYRQVPARDAYFAAKTGVTL